tara:strand:- start:5720 stop:6799 length:1080 start_codon:yes stop_codon:yes gene_type:complete
MVGCGQEEDKLGQLKSLKEEKKELEAQIKTLESELKAEGLLKAEINEISVTSVKMSPTPFKHEIEVRGGVESRKDVVLSAETMGRIVAINVTEGQKVSKGQLLIQLDADIIRNNIGEVETQLELAATIYEKQAKLWEQNIGTEVQYLQAKNNKESLESRLATLKSQLRQSNVYAPFSGVIDNVPARVGQMAQPGMQLVRIVNQDDMYITADVSESYLGKFSEGQVAKVYFPSQDKTIETKIMSVGSVIKSENRTFEIELKMPKIDFDAKPNQVVVLQLVDYKNESAFVVPTKVIQTDSKGSYLFEIVDEGGMKKAKKAYVTPGLSYKLQTEITEGLKNGQLIANEGYRDLSEGVVVIVK